MAAERYSDKPPYCGVVMKKILVAILAELTVISLGGCFPVFIPVGDHHHNHGYYHDRDYHRGW
jgi:hypothetical protein